MIRYELEKFISDVESPHESSSTATPACAWDGVVGNDEGEVIVIAWYGRKLCGTLHWEHTRSVKRLDVSNNALSGTRFFFIASKFGEIIKIIKIIKIYNDYTYNHTYKDYKDHKDTVSVPCCLLY